MIGHRHNECLPAMEWSVSIAAFLSAEIPRTSSRRGRDTAKGIGNVRSPATYGPSTIGGPPTPSDGAALRRDSPLEQTPVGPLPLLAGARADHRSREPPLTLATNPDGVPAARSDDNRPVIAQSLHLDTEPSASRMTTMTAHAARTKSPAKPQRRLQKLRTPMNAYFQ